mmetsp:Transcript_10054/g.15063  ORF Transcript_10054/g.15063 Transcript_10054/m.15063 type:complete len:274 (+) Transcript_10054:1329-2150(+)
MSQGPRETLYKAFVTLHETSAKCLNQRPKFETLADDDDEKWMYMTPASLEELLKSRGGGNGLAEDDGTKLLSEMAERMGKFVNQQSSFEGVEVDEKSIKNPDLDGNVSFDFSKLMQALHGEDNVSGKKEPKNFLDDDDDEDEEPSIRPCESRTDIKMRNYMDSMDVELTQAGLGKEFARGTGISNPEVSSSSVLKNSVKRNNSAPSVESVKESKADTTEDFRPVDVDLNLVQNLLESYSSQGGMPGPTSSILGSLGVRLPDNADNKSSKQSSR